MPVSSTTRNDDRTDLQRPAHPTRTRTSALLQVTAVLTLLVLAFQFVTAGALVSHPGASPDIHGAGAIVLHLITALTTVAAALHWRKRHTPAWPTVVAALVFVFSFVQAAIGDIGVMWLHVPGALVLTVGAVWLTAWSFSRSARR